MAKMIFKQQDPVEKMLITQGETTSEHEKIQIFGEPMHSTKEELIVKFD